MCVCVCYLSMQRPVAVPPPYKVSGEITPTTAHSQWPLDWKWRCGAIREKNTSSHFAIFYMLKNNKVLCIYAHLYDSSYFMCVLSYIPWNVEGLHFFELRQRRVHSHLKWKLYLQFLRAPAPNGLHLFHTIFSPINTDAPFLYTRVSLNSMRKQYLVLYKHCNPLIYLFYVCAFALRKLNSNLIVIPDAMMEKREKS